MISSCANDNGKELALCMEGHAGFAEQGKDIVCAAASMLGQALVSALGDVCDVSGITFNVRISPGKLYVEATSTPETRAMFKVAAAGLSDLTKKYPQNVSFRGEIA